MTTRDPTKFEFVCDHNHDHEHEPLMLAPESVLKIAAVNAAVVPGTLRASQAGKDAGLPDIPMMMARFVNPDGKERLYLIDPELAVRFGAALFAWGLEHDPLSEVVDDAD